jgi:hypothetical protein
MTNEEIKTLADGYYAGNADWLNKEQEQDTKVGWRQGFAYALRQFAVIKSLPDSDEIRMKARELDEKDFAQWMYELQKGNVL